MTNKVALEIDGKGIIKIELNETAAPITVENFKQLVADGFYDGLIFHRVISGFIKGEFRMNGVNNPISHLRGVISMARSGHPDSASSQFFICHEDAKFLDGQYAAFGKVFEGMDVVDRIANTATNSNDRPLTNQVIKGAYFID